MRTEQKQPKSDYTRPETAIVWVNPRQLHLARAVRAAFTEHVMLFSSLVSHGGADSRSPCWFRLNILKLIQKWQGSSSSFDEIYRYVFVRCMSLCKSLCFICGRGEPPCLCRASYWGSVWRDMRVPLCLSACFFGLNPRTVPQMSLTKYRAPICYRGLMPLGLNVSCFFRSLGK